MATPTETTAPEVAGRAYDNLAVKLLYTVDEVAILLSVGRSTVEKLIHEGYLASGIVQGTGRARRISRKQVDAFVESFDGAFPTYGKASKPTRNRRSRF